MQHEWCSFICCAWKKKNILPRSSSHWEQKYNKIMFHFQMAKVKFSAPQNIIGQPHSNFLCSCALPRGLTIHQNIWHAPESAWSSKQPAIITVTFMNLIEIQYVSVLSLSPITIVWQDWVFLSSCLLTTANVRWKKSRILNNWHNYS